MCLRQDEITGAAEVSLNLAQKTLSVSRGFYRSIDCACGCCIVPKCSQIRGVQKKRETEISKVRIPRAHELSSGNTFQRVAGTTIGPGTNSGRAE